MHPHIRNHGSPPILDDAYYAKWKEAMKSHISSSSVQLWRIIKQGFKLSYPNHLSPREVVDEQLKATAKHMLDKAMTKEIEDLYE